jgi:hypothetical protein
VLSTAASLLLLLLGCTSVHAVHAANVSSQRRCCCCCPTQCCCNPHCKAQSTLFMLPLTAANTGLGPLLLLLLRCIL